MAKPAPPRLTDVDGPASTVIQVSAPAPGDILPAGADTIQMATWTPPDVVQNEPSSWDEETRERALPKDSTTHSTPAIRPPPSAPVDHVPAAPPRPPPPSTDAKPTLVMPAAAIPVRPTSGEGPAVDGPAATVVMPAVDPLKRS
jgi:hypothetical protein